LRPPRIPASSLFFCRAAPAAARSYPRQWGGINGAVRQREGEEKSRPAPLEPKGAAPGKSNAGRKAGTHLFKVVYNAIWGSQLQALKALNESGASGLSESFLAWKRELERFAFLRSRLSNLSNRTLSPQNLSATRTGAFLATGVVSLKDFYDVVGPHLQPMRKHLVAFHAINRKCRVG
jgi:hypothetical protein